MRRALSALSRGAWVNLSEGLASFCMLLRPASDNGTCLPHCPCIRFMMWRSTPIQITFRMAENISVCLPLQVGRAKRAAAGTSNVAAAASPADTAASPESVSPLHQDLTSSDPCRSKSFRKGMTESSLSCAQYKAQLVGHGSLKAGSYTEWQMQYNVTQSEACDPQVTPDHSGKIYLLQAATAPSREDVEKKI